jgi:hypothetical protein
MSAEEPSKTLPEKPVENKTSVDNNTDALKSNLRSAIQSTNRALASLEDFLDTKVSKPVNYGLEQGSVLSEKVIYAYERRHEYGLPLVATSAAVVGGVVGLRRGRLPGAVAGLVSGGLAYTVIYTPAILADAMDSVVPKRRSSS